MTHELPPFLQDLLSAPPRAGEGVHNWLFSVARQLHRRDVHARFNAGRRKEMAKIVVGEL